MFDKGDPGRLFDLLDCLGEGTYGTVWTGVQKSTNLKCAVKIVKIDDDLPEIEQEIEIMKDSKSPYIVKFVGAYWGEKEKIWMVMEHCVAGSINDLMYVCDMTLNLEQVRSTAAAITLGLKYLHKNLVIHRDIKAGNVLLTDEGHVRLADFGVSAKLRKASDKTTTAIGAPFWMAPEVINEEQYDGKADVWSLGITIIELVEGRPPNSHMNAMKALFIIPQQQPPKLKDGRLPRDIQDFVRQCLIKSMKKRPTSKATLNHPFIKEEAKKIETNDGRSEIMRVLVLKSLKKIEKWRKDDGEDTSDEDDSVDDDVALSPTPTKKEKTSVYGINAGISVGETNTEGEEKTQTLYPPHMGQVTMTSGVTGKSSFLNPAKDRHLRASTRIEPLRDFRDPKDNRFGKEQQNEMDGNGVTAILNGTGGEAQAGVMTKEFITLLKTIYKSDPTAFGNKAPKNWTGEDITVAVVRALDKVLITGEDGVPAANDDIRNQPADAQDNALLDFMKLGTPEFVVGKDGELVPPPPPPELANLTVPDVDSDSELDL